MRVYTDFDGTVAACDVTDLVLARFASPEWETIQELWISGGIDASTCMRRQIALIDANREELDGLLDSVELDPGFVDFATWCAGNGMEITVVSDGVDYFIKRVLARHGFEHLPLYANKLCSDGQALALEHPWRRGECLVGSGVCKCSIVRQAQDRIVYIGDGRSDECVSSSADYLFAKDRLAIFCAEQNIPYFPFSTFMDVQRALSAILNDVNDASSLGAVAEPDLA